MPRLTQTGSQAASYTSGQWDSRFGTDCGHNLAIRGALLPPACQGGMPAGNSSFQGACLSYPRAQTAEPRGSELGAHLPAWTLCSAGGGRARRPPGAAGSGSAAGAAAARAPPLRIGATAAAAGTRYRGRRTGAEPCALLEEQAPGKRALCDSLCLSGRCIDRPSCNWKTHQSAPGQRTSTCCPALARGTRAAVAQAAHLPQAQQHADAGVEDVHHGDDKEEEVRLRLHRARQNEHQF